jgi:hypothetical protein
MVGGRPTKFQGVTNEADSSGGRLAPFSIPTLAQLNCDMANLHACQVSVPVEFS